jgi:uroporphyrin-3 C-methyltransferase
MNDTPPNDAAPAATPGAAADEEWVKRAAALAAGEPERRAETEPAAAPHGVLRATFLSSLALTLAFAALVVAGMLWWQYREFYVSLDETDAATAEALNRVRAEQRSLRDRLDGTREDIEALRERNASLAERLDALPGRFAALEERLDAVQGGSFDARANLLRSEAEYYLGVANTELELTGDFDSAITALQLADRRLAELGSPELAPVREAIAEELLALRSLRLPDIEGIVFGLGRLAARADTLPLRADLPASLVGEPDPAVLDAEPGLERLWLAFKGTLLDLVRIERRDEPVPQALSAAERELARRQLQVELELARIAALRGAEQGFLSGLETAIAILERNFDVASPDVEGALALLRELRSFDVAPDRPDISRSLSLLRTQRAGSR